MKIQADLPENINKALKVHQLRYNFKYLSDAMIDVLKRFFANEDYDYFLMKNEEKEVLKSDPNYLKALNKEEKVRKSPKKKS